MADRLTRIQANRAQRRRRVRAKIAGTATRPRLSVYISKRHIHAQIIDDQKGQTLAAASTLKQKLTGPLSQRASVIGEQLADKCQAIKIKQVVFDRGWRAYHGRLKNLAEAARKKGLKL